VRKARKAMSFWTNGLLVRCMFHWVSYARDSREGRERKVNAAGRAVRHWASGVVGRCFNMWVEDVRETVKTRRALRYWTNGLLARTWSHWVRYVESRLGLKEKARIGLSRWVRGLQWRCLARWLEYVESVRKARKAMSFWTNGLLVRCMSRWVAFVSRPRQTGKVEKVLAHWRSSLLSRILHRWSSYARRCAFLANQSAVVKRRYRLLVLLKAVSCWRRRAVVGRIARVAVGKRRTITLRKFFRSWRLAHTVARGKQGKLVQSMKHWQRSSKLHWFAVWRARVVVFRRKHDTSRRAVWLHRVTLLRKCVWRWRQGMAVQRLSQVARQRYAIILLLRTFSAWNSYVLREAAAGIMSTVMARWSKTSVLNCMLAWKGMWLRRAPAIRMAKRNRRRWLYTVLHAWRDAYVSGVLGDVSVPAPVITQQPQDVGCPLGNSVCLNVVAVGTGLKFQWSKDGSAIPGATQPTLPLTLRIDEDCGQFSCVITNDGGSATTQRVSVYVLAPPIITTQPDVHYVAEGERVRLSVTAMFGTSYQWYRDGFPLGHANKPELDVVATSDNCEVPYVCEVSNAAGAVASEEAVLYRRLRELEPELVRNEMWEVEIEWGPVYAPVGFTVDAYCVRVVESVPDGEDFVGEDVIVSGSTPTLKMDTFQGVPLVPSEVFTFVVCARLRRNTDGLCEWTPPGRTLTAGTRPPLRRAVLLEGRFPRVFHVKPFVFEPKSDRLFGGSDTDLPFVAELLKAIPTLTLSVEGHVNFGNSESNAHVLSCSRARAVRVRLQALGIDKARLRDVGHGHSRPRYPKSSSLSSKNRRVEFVITNPECLQLL
ncbi:MAG: OmpA family protein, partial [Terracidiphilus sp.]|nr:OmpA family protein [Terracidiphilus sp.]